MRLVGAAAQDVRAGLLDGDRGLDELFAALDRAGAGDDHEAVAADLHAADLDHGRLRLDLGAGELVRLEDRDDLLDAGERLERLQAGLAALVPDRADDVALDAVDDVGLVAEVADPLEDLVQLSLGRPLAHDDDHDRPLYPWKSLGVKRK